MDNTISYILELLRTNAISRSDLLKALKDVSKNNDAKIKKTKKKKIIERTEEEELKMLKKIIDTDNYSRYQKIYSIFDEYISVNNSSTIIAYHKSFSKLNPEKHKIEIFDYAVKSNMPLFCDILSEQREPLPDSDIFPVKDIIQHINNNYREQKKDSRANVLMLVKYNNRYYHYKAIKVMNYVRMFTQDKVYYLTEETNSQPNYIVFKCGYVYIATAITHNIEDNDGWLAVVDYDNILSPTEEKNNEVEATV